MSTPIPTDEELVEALRRGELAAFEALYDRYERRLFGYLRRTLGDRDLAEDLFQDVLLTVVRDRSFDPGRGRFSAWLFTVARNRCREQQRTHQRRGAKDQLVAAVEPPRTDPELAAARASQVRAAMAGLPEGHRQLLVLKQVGELTYQEIAAMLGVAEGTIKSRIHAAMKVFRRRLAELGDG